MKKEALKKEKEILKNEVFKKEKQFGVNRFKNSFVNSFHGIAHTYVNEQSMSLLFFVTIIMVVLGFLLKLSKIEWLFVILNLGLIGVTELLNTAIEAVVDKASPEINPLAKISKDTASGAVFIMCLVAFISGIIIYIPKIIEFFGNL